MRHALLALALFGLAAAASAQERGGDAGHYVPRLTLQADFGSAGVDTVKFQGVDLAGTANPALNAAEGGGLTGMQWAGIAFTAVVFGVIALEAADGEEDPTGTGGSGY